MQFTLQTLMLSVLVVASALGAFGPWGLVVAGVLLAIGVYIRNSDSMRQAVGRTCLVLVCSFFVLSFTPSPFRPIRTASPQTQCLNNLTQLGLALNIYHAQHGCFPPAHIADENGKAMHSWRVLILPSLEHDVLYDQYDFNEPWNGSNNRELKRKWMPHEYGCPSINTTSNTNYVAVVGPRTVWPNGGSVKLKNIKDGPENTILLIEFSGSDIHWMEPRDLSMEEVLRGFNVTSGRGLSPVHVRENDYFYNDTPAIHVVFADGSVHAIPADISREDLKGLLTIDGGEEIDVSKLYARKPHKKVPRWKRVSGFVALVFSLILFLFATRRNANERPLGKSV